MSPRELRALERAKAAWASAQAEDDLTERAASEARLTRKWPRPAARPVRPFVLGATIAAAAAVALFFALRPSRAPVVVVPQAPTPTAAPSVSVAALPDAPPAPSLVFATPCAECRVGGKAPVAGARLEVGTEVSVAAGAHVTLGFALTGALLDPRSGMDLDGPAAAGAADDHSISLERGVARFRGLRGMTVLVPGARIAATDATFTVNVDGRGQAHIAVESGHLDVAPTGKAAPTSIALDAGAALDVPAALPPPPPLPTATAEPVAPPPATEATVAEARSRFLAGDQDARQTLESLAQSKDVTVARRASFTLAEIELGNGQRDAGRKRLTDLATCPDVRLASDATTLLARTDTTPAARATTWQSFLATQPPSPYRERAMLERAEALFDAGQVADAKALVTELKAMSLSEAQRRQLDRLVYKMR